MSSVAAAAVAWPAVSASAKKPGFKVLGTDPAGDAPPALDLTYVSVARVGAALEVRLGIEGMLPVVGGYETLPGIEWVFSSKRRVFLAEAIIDTARPRFLFFERVEQGYRQLEDLEGTYDPADGYISFSIPLKLIDASRGTRIAGVELDSGADADSHVHVGPRTVYADTLKTTKSYAIP